MNEIIIALGLPILLLYFLMFLGLWERKQLQTDNRSVPRFFISARDAAIVAIALDFEQLVRSVGLIFPYIGQQPVSLTEPILYTALTALHFMSLAFVTRPSPVEKEHSVDRVFREKNISLFRLRDMYWAIAVLFTNGITIAAVISRAGGVGGGF